MSINMSALLFDRVVSDSKWSYGTKVCGPLDYSTFMRNCENVDYQR